MSKPGGTRLNATGAFQLGPSSLTNPGLRSDYLLRRRRVTYIKSDTSLSFKISRLPGRYGGISQRCVRG